MDLEMIENMRLNLINKLSFLVTVKDELWNYHPDNTERLDVVKEYQNVTEEIENLKYQISILADEE